MIWINAFFLKTLNMSVAASWLIAALLLLRPVLKRIAPKWLVCALWALVAIRLVFPAVPLHSGLSAYRLAGDAVQESGQVVYFSGFSDSDYIVASYTPATLLPGGEALLADDAPSAPTDTASLSTARGYHQGLLSALWAFGVLAMLAMALVSYVLVKGSVSVSAPLEKAVWLCDDISSPFILGILRPRIYLPSGMTEEAMACVLAHEQAHLRRWDHLWKPLGYLLLAVHWFNPLVWVAYWLFCRDIETACDERVIRTLDTAGRKVYSQTLLDCACGRRWVTACPLAFGEAGVKSRIKSVLHYKKPALWVMLAAVALCAVVAVCFMTDPPAKEQADAVEGSLATSETLPDADGDSASLQEDIRWSYDSGTIEAPYMTVNGGGTVFYMEVPDELAQRIRQRVAENVTLSGFTTPQFTDGWQRDLISWTAEKAEVHLVFAGDYSEFYTLCRGETQLWGLDTGENVVEADGEVRELLAMIAALTGWETNRGREAFTGLTMAELIYNGKTLHTVTDPQQLGSLQNLLQNGTQASFASKTPMERVELRMTRSDGTTVSVLLDTDTPRIFLPPFYYYTYNDFESTGTQPLLEALGLTAWPQETADTDCSPWLTARLATLIPLPDGSEYGLPQFQRAVSGVRYRPAHRLQMAGALPRRRRAA